MPTSLILYHTLFVGATHSESLLLRRKVLPRYIVSRRYNAFNDLRNQLGAYAQPLNAHFTRLTSYSMLP